jgi:hypothetical protein
MNPEALQFKPIAVATEQGDAAEGYLVTAEDVLAAVLVRLSPAAHSPHAGPHGTWCLDAGFGPCAGVEKTFASLEEAREWIAGRVADAPHLAKPETR